MADEIKIDPTGLPDYYKEQLAHGRHIELQRSSIAAIVFAIAGVVVGRALEKGAVGQWPYALLLSVAGVFGWLFSIKLYERFRLHNEVARIARDAWNPTLAQCRREAEKINKARFPRVFQWRLHVMWNCFFGLITLIGLLMLALSLRHRIG